MPDPSRPAPKPAVDYVFGYGSLVALQEQLVAEGAAFPAVEGRLRGFRRLWGAAMNNWEGANDPKHWIEPETGKRPQVRVVYLDIEPSGGEACDGEGSASREAFDGEGSAGRETVNGLAIPVDAAALAVLDRREVNYKRIDVSACFEPALPGAPPGRAVSQRPMWTPERRHVGASPCLAQRRVFAYRATDAARSRCRAGAADGSACVSSEYLARVRRGFADLGEEAIAEFDRTTEALPFPQRDLELVWSNI